jgi:RpiR family glv operon transcriptional regulator
LKLEELVNKNYEQLNQNDKHIWNYILMNKRLCSEININDLAKNCAVSRTTILRFAKKISLSGFSELKIHLKWDLEQEVSMMAESADIICEGYTRTIQELARKDFFPICRLIHQAKRVFIFGSGDYQMSVAKQLKLLFLHGGDCFYDFDAVTMNKEFFQIVNSEDLVLLISLDGESKSVVSVAQQLKLSHVPVISISKLKNSTLASLSTENIYMNNTKISFDNKSTKTFESTASLYLIAELLFVQYNLYKNQL